MNQPIPQFVSHVPIPLVCDGEILGKVSGSPRYDVAITKTQMGEFQGPIRAIPLYQSPMDSADYKDGDHVKVLVMFHYDINTEKYESAASMYSSYVLGRYDPESMIDVSVDNPLSEKGDDRVVIKNKNSEAALSLTDNYESVLTPGGSVSDTMKAFGAGIWKNCKYTMAQNYHRVISHNDPDYVSREHFGMFTGTDLEDETTKPLPADSLINYRRFVQQTRDPAKWVSTCEGAFAPWLGANIAHEELALGKDVLFTRIVNNEKSRITHECGEAGTDFITMRVDQVMAGEFTAPTPSGATPGLLGNRFKMSISDKGAVEIYAAGKGVPTANFAGFKLQITEDGELTVLAAKKIILSHSDADQKINSITLDSSGVNIYAQSGFTVNGKKLLNENFITFLLQIGAAGIATSVLPAGSPEPLAPAFIAALQANKLSPDTSPLGYLTAGVPLPILGIISQPDDFSTV